MSQRYYLALVTVLFINPSLLAMEKESFKPSYSITPKNSAEIVVVSAVIANAHIKKEESKKDKRTKKASVPAEKTDRVIHSPNNMRKVFERN
jgi:hypothetical protein